MLDQNREIKITDFGISSSINESASRVSVRPSASGTLAYMSPQQALGGRPSVADDVYSLGATIYELISGKPPFFRGDLYAQIRDVTPAAMAERREEFEISASAIPSRWEETIAACLEKDSARRPQSALEVAWRLGLVKDFEPKTAPEIPKPETIRVSNEKPKTAPPPASGAGRAGLIAALVVLLAGGALAGWWFGVEKPKEEAEQQKLAAAEAEQQQAAADAKAQADEAERQKQEANATAQAAQTEMQRQQEEAAKKKAEQQAAIANATKENPLENSLGMKFVPVPGTQVLFSIWDTRVADFRAYAQDTGYRQQGRVQVLKVVQNGNGGYSFSWEPDEGATWEEPGFSQGADYPVVGVSWNDANAFCAWLTKREQASGLIGPDQSYRLPTDEEWSAAVGSGKYPWGDDWPPPRGAGNYADDAFVATLPGTGWPQVPGNDGYAHTSPVGSFSENQYGLYDMGGNVWQWCEDPYRADMNESAVLEKFPMLRDDSASFGEPCRVVRGGSWFDCEPDRLLSSFRDSLIPPVRLVRAGFRCVLALAGQSSAERQPQQAEAKNEVEQSFTRPQDKNSQPPYWTQLRLAQHIMRPFRLLFSAYDGDANNPDSLTFQINTIDVNQPSQFVKIGDVIAGTKFKVMKFEYKQQGDSNTDVSELTVQNTETNNPVVLVLEHIANAPDSYALFRWNNTEFQVKKGNQFALLPDPKLRYRLIDVMDDHAIIQTPTGEQVTVPYIQP
jgi:formylglycine-generating enzyme required for sulfatase activity